MQPFSVFIHSTRSLHTSRVSPVCAAAHNTKSSVLSLHYEYIIFVVASITSFVGLNTVCYCCCTVLNYPLEKNIIHKPIIGFVGVEHLCGQSDRQGLLFHLFEVCLPFVWILNAGGIAVCFQSPVEQSIYSIVRKKACRHHSVETFIDKDCQRKDR